MSNGVVVTCDAAHTLLLSLDSVLVGKGLQGSGISSPANSEPQWCLAKAQPTAGCGWKVTLNLAT